MTTEPRLYYTETTHHGRLYSLALVVTHWGTEGTCLLERVTVARKAANIVHTGNWCIRSPDEGPSVLHVELEEPTDDIPDWFGLLDVLCAGLVDAGAADTFYQHDR